MDFSPRMLFLVGLVYAMVLLPAPGTSLDAFSRTRATYYRTYDGNGTASGSCGFGEYGRTVNEGHVSTVSNKLYRNGAGCGACYQVRCLHPLYCDKNGCYVVATDNGEGHNTDFILSQLSFTFLGSSPFATAHLYQYGELDVEYRRVPCEFSGYTIKFKITEESRNPGYLAIVILYVGGEHDVHAVQVLQEHNGEERRELRRVYGAVWELPNTPQGYNLRLFFQVGDNWVQSRYAIPSNWEPGTTYETRMGH